jgi:methanogenic corrinoid protein MtbC1
MTDNEKIISRFQQALVSLDRLEAKDILLAAGDTWSPIQIVETIVVPALEHIGSGWEQGAIALSQVYMSGRICEELVEEILPENAPTRKHQPKMAIAVLQDYHLLGKRIVHSALRASGYRLKDYGRVESESLVEKTIKDGINVLFLSTLMLPAALKVKEVRDALVREQRNTQIVVGGAPFRLDSQLWKDVGADAMGKTAGDAVDFINTIMGVHS